MYKGLEIGLKEGLVVTFFSMAVVFVALIVISYTIDAMRYFVDKNKN
jgi:Na+-transporting methylmalonyl-CoA/oxaloacetate decarboxylase gamma subunit